VSTVYPILKSKNKRINLFIPSEKKTIKAKIVYKGYDDKKIKGKSYNLKKYNLIYNNNSFEIFVDKLGSIAFIDWSSLGYTSEITSNKIFSFDTKKVKHNYKMKVKNIKINGYPVKIYNYIPLKKKNGKRIFIIDGVMFPMLKNDSGDTLSENIFLTN
jgi:hypothetical protein